MQTIVVRVCEHRAMTNDERLSISITLSPTQIDAVVRAATHSRAPSVSTLIANALRTPLQSQDAQSGSPPAHDHTGYALDEYLSAETVDPRLSRSLLRGLSILTRFGPDGAARGIVELAGDLGMSPSTAHRYAFTLVELGLLERCPKTRKYRLPGT
jgi:IclR helix-turn-helix domain